MINWYLTAKKVHRAIVFPLVLLIVIMSLTGTVLKYPRLLGSIINPGLASFIHNQVSTFFAILLFVMAITGLILYLYPIIKKRQTNGR